MLAPDGVMHTACMYVHAAGKTHSNPCKSQIMGNQCRLRQALHIATSSSFPLLYPRPYHLSCLFQLQRAHQSAQRHKQRVFQRVCHQKHGCYSMHHKRDHDGLAAYKNSAAMIGSICKVCCKPSLLHHEDTGGKSAEYWHC